MASIYIATPKTSHAVTEVATTTSLKTLLQVATPSTTGVVVLGWGISFDGTSATGEPIPVVLITTDVAATVTSLTPDKWIDENDEASLCVGGASATGYNASAEGTITSSFLLDAQEVHPQTGYGVWYQIGAQPRVKPSRFLRVRTTAPAGVNAIPWIVWLE